MWRVSATRLFQTRVLPQALLFRRALEQTIDGLQSIRCVHNWWTRGANEGVDVVDETAQLEQCGARSEAGIRRARAGGVRGAELAAEIDQRGGPQSLIDRWLSELTDLTGKGAIRLPCEADAALGLVCFGCTRLRGLFVLLVLWECLGVEKIAGAGEDDENRELSHGERIPRLLEIRRVCGDAASRDQRPEVNPRPVYCAEIPE